jgi:iron-sulfur cluster assembly accessory protein
MATVTEQETIGLKTDAPEAAPPGIIVTPKAADEVRRIVAEQQASGSSEKMYLRMRVVGGGCSGFQHKLDLDTVVNPKLDEVFAAHGVEIVVDKRSLLYLNGVTVDYHNDLNRRGFSVSNPQAKSTCGCGSSFSM